MDSLTAYADRLNHLPIDLRAEVVLADMLDDGISLNDLILNPAGDFKRPFGRDISQVRWIDTPHTSQRWLQIDLNRTGLYDLLPEGVFHQPTTGDAATSTEAVLLEMKVQHEREQAARQFFLPIEQEFFRQRVQVEQEGRLFLPGKDTPLPDDLLGKFWSLPDFLTPTQTNRLLYLLPLMHRIAGDVAAMTACVEQLLDEPVHLQVDPPGRTLVEADTPPLGQWQLGGNSVFDGWLRDEEPLLRLTVFIDRPARVTDYLPGGNSRRLIEWLAGYLVPLDAAIGIELDTSALDDAFSLTDDNAFARLDFTTHI